VLTEAGFAAALVEGRITVDGAADGAVIVETLAAQRIYPSWLMPVQVDLEQAFLELTEDEEGEL
jgi:hypothetical protein